jgi:hypothetical protein
LLRIQKPPSPLSPLSFSRFFSGLGVTEPVTLVTDATAQATAEEDSDRRYAIGRAGRRYLTTWPRLAQPFRPSKDEWWRERSDAVFDHSTGTRDDHGDLLANQVSRQFR